MCDILYPIRAIVAFCRENADVLLSTFFGGMGGVYIAFMLERLKDKNRVIEKRYYAVNKALFALFGQWNTLYNFDKDFLRENRDKPNRWLTLPAMPPGCKSTPRVDTESLLFLLQNRFCPNLLAELFVSQNNVQQLVELIAYRNDLRRQITDQAYRQDLNPRTENELQVTGEALFEKVPAAIELVSDLSKRLSACWMKVYPKQEPMSFAVKDEGTS